MSLPLYGEPALAPQFPHSIYQIINPALARPSPQPQAHTQASRTAPFNLCTSITLINLKSTAQPQKGLSTLSSSRRHVHTATVVPHRIPHPSAAPSRASCMLAQSYVPRKIGILPSPRYGTWIHTIDPSHRTQGERACARLANLAMEAFCGHSLHGTRFLSVEKPKPKEGERGVRGKCGDRLLRKVIMRRER
ncbi:hypothetical protein BU26DRAFT_96681 [Trematosphaeria pertusa]|uniref:Uncharacterized protein n=1 Tax=Trematosphaeria pertusa TaxID=390896 RepID=A0A6A6I3S7_9PLEO|nr:uncharacterized protein BU26DRAFT_96681 [Trematosphaeria pertusa]KAF2244250.1 hypothetical protein BU26DRAFT_96681 [Trematosphaeria pertusa]